MLKIIDISDNNVITDWDTVKRQCDGVIIKATEGVTYVNPDLLKSVLGCERVGLPYGFYHFARRNNPYQEYLHFLNIVRSYNNKLPLFLDYEEDNPDFEFIKEFMIYNNDLKFYSSHSIADNTNIANNRIWLANPTEKVPGTLGNYLGIQYSWKSRFNGIVGDVDVSVFDDGVLNSLYEPSKSKLILNSIYGENNLKESVSMVAIKVGEIGNRVRMLQAILKVCINNDLVIDGNFGSATESAVKTYQSIMHIGVDGVVGEETINTLLSDLRGGWFKA